jgi:hypothetical protein
MRPTKKETKRTLPKRKPAKASRPEKKSATKKAKVKVKPLFTLKGIPAKYKVVCNIVLAHATSQIECDELLLAGVSAFETLHETETPETAAKLELQIVTKAILLKKETFKPVDETESGL